MNLRGISWKGCEGTKKDMIGTGSARNINPPPKGYKLIKNLKDAVYQPGDLVTWGGINSWYCIPRSDTLAGYQATGSLLIARKVPCKSSK